MSDWSKVTTADSGPERVDEAVLGGGQAGRAGAAALPELRALPASAVRDLRELHVAST